MIRPVVGRDEPLAMLGSFVEEVSTRPRTLLVEGDPGIGKTTVWQVAVDLAVERGYRVLAARPAESETGLGYAGLADLLADIDDAWFAGLPEPQRQALDTALLRSEPAGRDLTPRTIFTGFGGVLRALGQASPVLVAVDDRQWLDPSSVRALDFVARRIVDEPVGMLFTARPDGVRAFTAPADSLLRLGPLSPDAVHQLARAHSGVSLSRAQVLRMHRMTEGNPFFVLQLLEVLIAAGLPEAHEQWPVPEDMRDLVTARMAPLPGPVRSALLAAAASARPTVSWLDADAMSAVKGSGIVTIAGDGRVRFAHPLFASAIYRNATPAERRAVHAALADRADNIEERARHEALACEEPDERVVELLDRAAASAVGRGAPDLAAELAEQAGLLTPPDRPLAAWWRRFGSADFRSRAGDLHTAREALLELVKVDVPAHQRSTGLRLLGEICYRLGSVEEALRFLKEACAAADDPASLAKAEMSYALAAFYSFGDYAEAGAAVARAIALAEQPPVDSGLLSRALASSTVTDLLLGGGLDQNRLHQALELEDPDETAAVEGRTSVLAAVAYLHVEQFDQARSHLERVRDHLLDRGEDGDLPLVLAELARAECFAGNLDRAAATAQRGCELAEQAGSTSGVAHNRGVQALAYAHQGQVDETRMAAAEAIDAGRRSGWVIGAFFAACALCHLELMLGNNEAAIATVAQSLELVEASGLVEPARRPYLPDAIEAMARLGDLDRAGRLTIMLTECAQSAGRPSWLVAAARCAAILDVARGDIDTARRGLDSVLAQVPDVPMPLELARTLIVKGQLERRRKHRNESRASLAVALQICEATGARLWAQQARDELARLGPSSDVDGLTASELRVALLAASGKANREIAAAAFISQKTVEANISRIYRKLGIHSRAELGAWLAAREQATR
ncbi:MAG: AAA family ATPase [Nocardioidaceae bacterium]